MVPVAPVKVLPSLSGASSSPLITVSLAPAGSSSAALPASPGGRDDDPWVRTAQSSVDAATVLRSSQQVSREAADAAAGAYPAQVLAEWNRQLDSRWRVGTAQAVTGRNVLEAVGATALAHALLGNGGSCLPA
ncbi:MAG: hypothetical protein EBT09_01735 [Actinobacteria bacterium]|nr:hypothetical protein [Actinomycetota bacterium]